MTLWGRETPTPGVGETSGFGHSDGGSVTFPGTPDAGLMDLARRLAELAPDQRAAVMRWADLADPGRRE
jgi:hypothetical protein